MKNNKKSHKNKIHEIHSKQLIQFDLSIRVTRTKTKKNKCIFVGAIEMRKIVSISVCPLTDMSKLFQFSFESFDDSLQTRQRRKPTHNEMSIRSMTMSTRRCVRMC